MADSVQTALDLAASLRKKAEATVLPKPDRVEA
jgi:hypothetical protein